MTLNFLYDLKGQFTYNKNSVIILTLPNLHDSVDPTDFHCIRVDKYDRFFLIYKVLLLQYFP